MNKTLYIGLNDNFHDPAFCILNDDGEILFAEGTERPLQYKRALGCPSDLDFYIDEVLNNYVNYKVDRVVLASSWNNMSHFKARAFSLYSFLKGKKTSMFPDVEMSIKRHVSALNQAGAGLERALKYKFPDIKIEKKYFNHHLCHIANAITASSYKNGIGLVIDGKGDDTSFSYYRVIDGTPTQPKKNSKYYSLGYLYGFFTEICGYSQLKGEEWKVMGLSAYGKKNDEFLAFLHETVLNKKIGLESAEIVGLVAKIKTYIRDCNITVEEIACVAQLIFEDIFFKIIDEIISEIGRVDTIFISGGSALNTLAIGKLYEKGLFKNIIVPNAPADDGNAIGAAMLAYKLVNGQSHNGIRSAYTGSEINDYDIEKFILTSKLPFKKNNNVAKYAAELLNNDKIIGWIQGRAEFGPRSLGNRSILAHPGYAANKDRINQVVKFRESYRPFAPSILHEFGKEYFEKYSFTPFMEKTLTYKSEVRGKVPSVVHVDGTGRVQSVTKEMNLKFHELINEFFTLTNIPMVVNTSYNVMGKPIVHDLNDVMAVFFNSSIDAVFINDYVIERKDLG